LLELHERFEGVVDVDLTAAPVVDEGPLALSVSAAG
jgi:hypothetical protein